MNYLNLLTLLAPEAILVVTALVILGIGLSPKWECARPLLSRIALLGGLVAAFVLFRFPEDVNLMNGALVLDPLVRFFKGVLIGLSLMTVVFSTESVIRKHFAEYLAMILFATVGMMLLVGTEELLMVFVALELVSISLYVLTAYAKENNASAEAGLKYFLIGGVCAAFLLFGLSLVYGVAGTTNLRVLAKLSPEIAQDPLLLVGIAFVLVGFGFKVAAVPFHLWAPDVYEGAPIPSAALIASGSKVAGFFILAKLLGMGFMQSTGMGLIPVSVSGNAQGIVVSAEKVYFSCAPGWVMLIAIMAAVSVVLGNLAALVQTNVRRLLAYSAIAHSGYMLIALTSINNEGLAPVLFYVIIYALTTLGAFGVVSIVERQRGGSTLSDFVGFSRTEPVLAVSLMVFLISLAGIPPLVGFFGKFYLFSAALKGLSVSQNPTMLGLVALAIAMNAVSLYYYLIVLKHAFVIAPDKEAKPVQKARVTGSFILVVVLALAVFLLGLCPETLLRPLHLLVKTYLGTL